MKSNHPDNGKNGKHSEPPIAIVGMACIFPKAKDLASYWSNIVKKVDAITDIPSTHWKPGDYFNDDPKVTDHTYARKGGFISPVEFDPLEFGITPNAVEATDTSQLLGLIIAREALNDAGYGAGKEFNREKVSVILGITGALELVIPLGARLGHPRWRKALRDSGIDSEKTEEVVKRISDSYVGWQENSFPGLLGNVVAGRIANRLDFGGTNCVVDAACASSLSALHLSCLELNTGRSDMVLAGGLDTFNDIFMYMCFSKTPVLSPTGHARPFDHKEDGTVLGEGAGVLILKRLEDAKRDNDKIYALIKGVGSSSDGKGNAIYMPTSSGQARALKDAYKRARVSPESIELVEAHGTGTKVGDAAEVNALSGVYSESGREGSWCALGSVKSQIGHTKAAAGIAGLIKSVMALQNKVLPPTIKVDKPIKEVSPGKTPFYINTEARPWIKELDTPRRAAVSAFGFGGSNFHCVLEEYEAEKESVLWDPDIEIMAFSSSNVIGLAEKINRFSGGLSWEQVISEAPEIRGSFDSSDNCRISMVLNRSGKSVAQVLKSSLQMLERSPDKSEWSTPDHVFFQNRAAVSQKLGIIFPGQGSQYCGMLRELACSFPSLHSALEKSNEAFKKFGKNKINSGISEYIFPLSMFDENTRQKSELELRRTEIAQPSIGAVSLGSFRILEYFGVEAHSFAGHSFGELTALAASGRVKEDDFFMMSAVRGELMGRPNGTEGGMIAVRARVGDVEKIIREEKLSLVIANRNAPAQVVLSGALNEVERAADIFLKKRVSHIRLPVSGAFHSSLVSGCQNSFFQSVRGVNLRSDFKPVFSNTTGELYPGKSDAALKLLSRQLAEPVEFISMIENMYKSGITTFLEVGPGSKLSKIVSEILVDRPVNSFSLDSSSGRAGGLHDLAVTLSRLAVDGYALKLSNWNRGVFKRDGGENKKKAITIPICGANYFRPAYREESPEVSSVNGKTGGATEKPLKEKQDKMALKKELTELKPFVEKREPGNPAGNASFTGSSWLKESLKVTGESMIALQKMQEETAKLHSQFLMGQTRAQEALVSLMNRQQALLNKDGFPDIPVENNQRGPVHVKPADSVAPAHQVVDTSGGGPHKSSSSSDYENGVKGQNTDGQIIEVLLQVISEKTGYPVEMLELDMGMDSDLGIDSIKQVEILSAISERLPDSPEVKPDQMGRLRTLKELACYLSDCGAENDTTKRDISDKIKNDLSSIEQVLFDVVSEKTGYPVEMLEPDMGMDSDLGIDSIKQVEILSAISERLPGSPEVKPDQMGRLRTLKELASYLSKSDTDDATEKEKSVEIKDALSSIEQVLFDVVSEKTGYPVEMLEPDMEMDSDLGIDSIKQVEILSAISERLPESPEVKPDQMGTLRTLRELGRFLGNGAVGVGILERVSVLSPGDEAGDSGYSSTGIEKSVLFPAPLDPSIERKDYSIKKGSAIWIVSDGSTLAREVSKKLDAGGYKTTLLKLGAGGTPDRPDLLGGLIIISPAGNIQDNYYRQILEITQLAGPALRLSAKSDGASFVTVSRLDGSFGLNGLGAGMNPLTGGLSGFSKTVHHEWPEVNVRAIDLTLDPPAGESAATLIVDEIFKRGPVEVGISKIGLTGLSLKKMTLPESSARIVLNREDVILITGGGRGVTAEAAVKIAGAYGCRVILIGRTRINSGEPAWLQEVKGEREIKKAILENSNGNKPTPGYIEGIYRNISASREIERNIRRVKDAGSEVHYISSDVTDESGFAEVVADIQARFGPVTGVIHGAGVLFDRRIEDKTAEQFEMVLRTKVSCINTILSSINTEKLKILVFFSSSTGRYGRTGQVDYAVANEILNKIAQKQARLLKRCRVLSLNWGPWDGGMVTPELKKIFEKEGVGVIGLSQGAEYLINEIESGRDGEVEIVVLGKKSSAGEPRFTSGKIISALSETPMKRAFLYDLSPERFSFLSSHIINGKPVLPMAVMIEWCAQAALHSNPGLHFKGFNGFRVLKGVVIEPGAGCSIEILTGAAAKLGDSFLLPVEVRGVGNGKSGVLHARGEFILSSSHLPETRKIDVNTDTITSYDSSVIYSEHLFHGESFQSIIRVEACDMEGVQALVKSAPPPLEWITNPERSTWITDPLVIDSAFQAMILWTIDRYGAESLPCSVGRYRQYQRKFPEDGVRLKSEIIVSNDKLARSDISFLDSKNFLIARIEEYECALSSSLRRAFNHG